MQYCQHCGSSLKELKSVDSWTSRYLCIDKNCRTLFTIFYGDYQGGGSDHTHSEYVSMSVFEQLMGIESDKPEPRPTTVVKIKRKPSQKPVKPEGKSNLYIDPKVEQEVSKCTDVPLSENEMLLYERKVRDGNFSSMEILFATAFFSAQDHTALVGIAIKLLKENKLLDAKLSELRWKLNPGHGAY